MVNYQNGKIYKIINDELNLTYYGSTCNSLYKRLSDHKHKTNKTNSKILFSTQTKAEIILVEKFPCNDKMELHQRERFYIENNECVNKTIPTRTRKEYREDNKSEITEYNKEYYEKNKEKENLRCKKYKEENKEKIRAQVKQYRQDNKELMNEKDKLQYQKRKEYYKQRYLKNKDKILKQQKEFRLKKKLLKSQSD